MDELTPLIAAASRGNLDSYGRIVVRFQRMAYGAAFAILGNHADAEDAAQEAFIAAHHELVAGKLREPDRFAGWLRTIVVRQCSRITRGRKLATHSMAAVADVPSPAPDPAVAAEKAELAEQVNSALRALSDRQRMAATLFYIGGYDTNEIAAFLDVPVTTVKKRLHDARQKLKERMIDMIATTLDSQSPDERFSKAVIDRLRAEPNLLDIAGHPVRQVAELIASELAEYTWVAGDEVVNGADQVNPWYLQHAYHLDEQTILRTETAVTLLQVLPGRKPPVRLVTAGRVFDSRADAAQIRHELSVLCVARDANEAMMKATLQRICDAALGSGELHYEPNTLPGYESVAGANIVYDGATHGVAGVAVMTAATLKQAGFHRSQVGGFLISVGSLDRLAELRQER